jgi:5-methylcytosine-specific restriction protein A
MTGYAPLQMPKELSCFSGARDDSIELAKDETRLYSEFTKWLVMSTKIPKINRRHILAAIRDLDQGAKHQFGESTGYDVLFNERRYAPKAVVGLAAGKLTGTPLGPHDFKGGIRSKCFRVLQANGFTIITKGETHPFPDEIGELEGYSEGAAQRVSVNRYERDPTARARAIQHYGPRCQVCGFDFEAAYGILGQGFIHVHHTVPLSQIGKAYLVDPVNDLRPVCPNCHAMLHKRFPPYTTDELREIMQATRLE